MVRYGIILLCGALLMACGAPETESIRFGLATAPVNLDPRFATDATSERINRLLYARLVDFDKHSRPVPALATWEMLSERHYRFRLGEAGRLFHDGSRLDVEDVTATYRSVLDPETASPHRGTLAVIERIQVVDADTLDFFLKRADALFPGYLSIGILPAAGIEATAAFHHHPTGSGPFRLRSWPESGRLELIRIKDRQVFVFEQVHDPTMRVLKLLRGEVDILQNDLPPELLHYLAGRTGIDVQKHTGSNFSYLGFQLQDQDTGKWEVRRAIALAIDRQAIIEYVFRGAARPASALLVPEHWAGSADLDSIETDLDMARVLLTQAGYGAGHPLRISYKTSSDPFRVRIATILQQQLAQAGIEVDVQSGDIKDGRFQMYSLAWVGVKSPDIFRYAFHSQSLPPAGANRGRLDDVQIDRMIEQAMATTDPRQQAVIYTDLQARLFEQLVYIPLWYEDQYSAARDNIKGYRLTADGNYDTLLSTFRR